LLTGVTGQVGSALQKTLPALGEVLPLGRPQLDLARPDSIREVVRIAKPDVIVNAAAYTAVDQAEQDEALAFTVNRDGPSILAEEAARHGALLVHFSSDYVFDGDKPSPYLETDAPNPLNAYGRSKLAGEQAIRDSGCRHLILRTSWVYSEHGKNFLMTMLRLAGEHKTLRIVDDQHGAPTSTRMIGEAVPKVIAGVLEEDGLAGLYHFTAAGSTSWHGFARAIFRERALSVSTSAISSADYPSAARRPRNSRLDNTKLATNLGIRLPDWEAGLRDVVARVGL
jgi:dTDP-4-dehydrorhamnose reductase